MSQENISGQPGREEMLSALFAHMVMQQASMAEMLLGKTPHPQTGQTMRDLDGAKLFIDQLEMLEAKTKGNLSRDEENLLKQSLMALRLAFVEAAQSPQPEPAAEKAAPEPEQKPAAPETSASAEEESKKKFSKKY